MRCVGFPTPCERIQACSDGKSADSRLEVAGFDTSIKGKLGMKRLGQDRLSASNWLPCSVVEGFDK